MRTTIGSKDNDTGEMLVHQAGSTAGYHTLCGISLDDNEFTEAPIPSSARISCASCFSVWRDARYLADRDFTTSVVKHA